MGLLRSYWGDIMANIVWRKTNNKINAYSNKECNKDCRYCTLPNCHNYGAYFYYLTQHIQIEEGDIVKDYLSKGKETFTLVKIKDNIHCSVLLSNGVQLPYLLNDLTFVKRG